MLRTRSHLTAVSILALMLIGCAAKPQETGFLSDYSKLEPVQGRENFLRYIASDSVLVQYQKLIVDPVVVKFYDKSEAKDVKQRDIDHLAAFFTDHLKKDLEDANFRLTTLPGPGVARIRIAVTNLKPSTPALNILPQTKLTGIGLGQASVEGEIVDSLTGKQLVAAIKSDTGSRFSLSGLSEWGDVEAVMTDWSKQIVARLAAARDTYRSARAD